MAEKEDMEQVFGRKADCPPPEGLEKYLDQPDELSLDSHVQQCLACQTELTLLREFLETEPRPEEEQEVDQIVQEVRRRRSTEGLRREAVSRVAPVVSLQGKRGWLVRPGFSLAAIAAAALLILVGVGVLNGPSHLVEPQTDTLRSGQLTVESPVGSLSSRPRELTFQPVSDATIYRVDLYDVAGQPVWSVTSQVAQLELPETVRAIMLPGRTLYWHVTAVDRDGKVLADSDRIWFRLELKQ